MAGQTKIRVFDQLHGVPKIRNLVVPFTIENSQSSVFVCLAPCSCCWCCCCGCGFNQSRLVEAKVADLKEVSITYATFLGSDSLCFPFKNIIIVFWNSEPAGVDRKCRTQITHLPTLANTQDGLQNKLVYLLNVIQEITIEKYRCLANYCALFTFLKKGD